MPQQPKQKAQQKKLNSTIQEAKQNKKEKTTGVPTGKTPASSKGLFSLFGGKKDLPITVQETLRYENMYRDGICQIDRTHFSKTIEFFDINYQLAQNDDKTQIFENYCDFLNYFDSTIAVQLTFFNQKTHMEDFQKNIDIPPKMMILIPFAKNMPVCSKGNSKKETMD